MRHTVVTNVEVLLLTVGMSFVVGLFTTCAIISACDVVVVIALAIIVIAALALMIISGNGSRERK